MRSISLTARLLIASAAIGGLSSGLLDRALIATPAWRHLGAQTWADYSRHADLGNGVYVYSITNISWAVLAVGAAISLRTGRLAPRHAALPVYIAASSMIAVMAITLKAAPIMFSLRTLGNNTVALQNAFDQFTFWGVYLRGAVTVLAFLSTVWALATYLRPQPADTSHPQPATPTSA
jgi:hypothetical protein